MNKKSIYHTLSLHTLMLTMLLTVACENESDAPATTHYEDGVSTVIYDLPGDTGTTMGGDNPRPFNTFFFQLATKTQSWDTTAAFRHSTAWDIAFTDVYNSMLYTNQGTNQQSPGYGGTGNGAIVYYDKPYADVTEAPSDEYFATHNLNHVGWDGYPQPYNRGWYFYEMNTHIATPIRNRTFVLRTAEGQYAKLEIINIYQGNPPVVTDLHWPAPYFTFRYYVQKNGSRNLHTPH